MNGSRPRRKRVAPGAGGLAVAILVASAAFAEDEKTLPDWIPSAGLGFGLQSREIDGKIDAILFEGTGPPVGNAQPLTMPCQTQPPSIPTLPPLSGFCDASGDGNNASDGAAFDISAQLLGPSWDSIPLRPRPYVDAGYAFEYDSRTIVETGLIPSAFDTSGLEPRLHTRLRANPEDMWYVGGGIALQMPIEFTPVFVKIGGHYSEERLDAVGTIDRGFAVGIDQVAVVSTENAEGLKITGAGPSVGVEAEIWRFGPVALQFVADVFFTFPLSGTETSFDLMEPSGGGDPPSCSAEPNNPVCNPPAHFDFDADNMQYFGVASLRFAWTGY